MNFFAGKSLMSPTVPHGAVSDTDSDNSCDYGGGSKRHDDAPQLVWVRNKAGAS